MENFEYFNPTKIVFGAGELNRLAEFVPKTRILFLYGGGSIKQNGVYDSVKKTLAGYELFELGGVQPNPTYEKAMEAVELIKKENIEFILAVGGGSVLDSAKFISLAVHHQGEPWEILTKREFNGTKAVPFGGVLTLPATGSEMNRFFVLSRGDQKLAFGHPLIYPQFSLLDPTVTVSLDQRQIGNGVVDAFVHTLEQYLTYPANAPLQDRMAEGVLLTLIEEGPKTYQRPKDLTARSNHMWAATMALSGIFGVGVPQDWSTHGIGHELTALYGIDHARTLAIVMPAMMWAMRDEKREKISQYAERVWKLQGSDQELLRGAIRKTTDFFESMGLPTKLAAYGVKEDVIQKVVSRFEARGFEPMGEKNLVNLEKVAEVLRLSLQ